VVEQKWFRNLSNANLKQVLLICENLNKWDSLGSFIRHCHDVLEETFVQSAEEEAAATQVRNKIESLTPRQREVVELVSLGEDNQQIADELHISVLTVKKHLQAVFPTMKVMHRTELTAKWHQAHCITLY
jgi:DNA-binding NarL/FixJ family response regulator